MANITRRPEGGEVQRRAGQRPYWNPFDVFSGLAAWAGPFGGLMPPAPSRRFVPAFDVRETKDAYVFEADLPGIKEDEFEISLSGNQLSVSGKRESVRREENERYSCSERAHGTFERTFTLSDDAEPERVNAEFRDGVLQIEIAKRTEPQARRVRLRGMQGGEGGEQEEEGGGQQQRSSRREGASSGHRRRAAQRQAAKRKR